jgi:hypothetical protein
MYAACLHCHRDLGRNDVIELFPIGRRLAFDSAKGRLWVICPACDRWNLSPIEERWEAVESCDRLFRGQKLRAQTDNVGLARLADGTDLIRIGAPLRPEFAAWRYGRVFSARLHRRMAAGAGIGAIAGFTAHALSGSALMASIGVVGPLAIPPLFHIGLMLKTVGDMRSIKVVGHDGKALRVNKANLDHTRIVPTDDAPLHLRLQHSYGRVELHGDRATRALGTLLARINRRGAGIGTTGQAASYIMNAGDPAKAIANIAREAERRAGNYEELAAEVARAPRGRTMEEALQRQFEVQRKIQAQHPFWTNGVRIGNPGALFRLPRVQRLALEMALHEASEQRALDEELESLERAWREAEEVAAIADTLLEHPSVDRKIEELKRSR